LKHLILTLLSSILLLGVTYSQNGGQVNENNSTKVEVTGFFSTYTVVKVTNKQPCAANIKLKHSGNSWTKSIPGNSSDTFRIITLPGDKIQAKTETNCGNADFGLVETIVNISLPIEFKYLIIKRLEDNKFYIEFVALDTDGEDSFEVELSNDGKHWVTKSIIFPDPIVPNHIYKTTIKL
jgi:hypothetical protein